LGLQWLDVNFDGSLIHVRRTWTWGKVGQPKSKVSQAPVPMHLLLAEFMRAWQIRTPYPQPEDWVFPSFRLDGRKPRAANMQVEDHLRPAALKTTLQLYAHSVSADRMTAQGEVLQAILDTKPAENGLSAD
jgi:integrase